MLKIFNDLKVFFEDNYRRVNVREYARMHKISAPSASNLLKYYEKHGLLTKEVEKKYYYYSANRENALFVRIANAYWQDKLKGLTNHLENELVTPVIILFGSIAKGEATKTSDIDIAVFTPSQKKLAIEEFEKKLERKIQVFVFKNQKEVDSKELLKNMLNGVKISGRW